MSSQRDLQTLISKKQYNVVTKRPPNPNFQKRIQCNQNLPTIEAEECGKSIGFSHIEIHGNHGHHMSIGCSSLLWLRQHVIGSSLAAPTPAQPSPISSCSSLPLIHQNTLNRIQIFPFEIRWSSDYSVSIHHRLQIRCNPLQICTRSAHRSHGNSPAPHFFWSYMSRRRQKSEWWRS